MGDGAGFGTSMRRPNLASVYTLKKKCIERIRELARGMRRFPIVGPDITKRLLASVTVVGVGFAETTGRIMYRVTEAGQVQ